MDKVALVKSEYREQLWIGRVRQCQSSGQTVKAWCTINEINIKSYYYWLRKLREKVCENIPVKVRETVITASTIVTLHACGITAEISDSASAEAIEAVIRALKQC